MTRASLLVKCAPSKPKLIAFSGSGWVFSSHVRLASGSTKRRISQALARRSAHSGLRVTQVRPRSVSPGASAVCDCVGNSSFLTSASAAARLACARARDAVGKKSSAAMLSNSRRCLCTTREIALGSEWPKPMRRLSTVLIRFS